MFIDDRPNRLRLEVASLQCARFQQHAPKLGFSFAPHPLHQRQLEALFPPMKQRGRNPQPFCQLFQNMLPDSGSKLPFHRKRSHPLYEFMVEQGHAHFERRRHAHSVDFGKNVGIQICLGIEVQQAAQPVPGWSTIVDPLPFQQRIRKALCTVQKLSREQVPFTMQSGQKRDSVQITITISQRCIPCQVFPVHSGRDQAMNAIAIDWSQPAREGIEFPPFHGH